MPIIYRATKGAPLSIAEMDGNFKDLHERVKALEENPHHFEQISDIKSSGDAIEIISSKGKRFGPIKLPVAMFNPRGKWVTNTPYTVMDTVHLKQKLYVCVKAHTSKSFTAELANWKVLLDYTVEPIASSSKQEALSQLKTYEKESLPPATELGQLALLVEGESLKPVYSDGKDWRFVGSDKSI